MTKTNVKTQEFSLDFFKLTLEKLEEKDLAYWERNQLVALLTTIFPSYLAKHPEDDKSWERDWMNIVYLNMPTGQISYHIHDSELEYFSHLKYENNEWDGHDNPEKYKRISDSYRKYKLKDHTLDHEDKILGEIMPIEEFIEQCKVKFFMRYDGTGFYAFKNKTSNLEADPYKIKRGIVDYRFTHVAWFNK